MADSIDFSKTQRIVLLIDLNPLSQSQNPNSNYITSIVTSSKILLSFRSLSSSLFAFRFFFSSLSPIHSASTVQRLLPGYLSTSLIFNSPLQTLDSLSQILNSISSTQLIHSPSNASHTASSLLQLVRYYDWESQIENLTGTRHNDLLGIRSNLIILLSPVCRSLKSLAEFMSVDVNDSSITNLDDYAAKFRDCFGVVNDAFNSKDMHFCWIDIDYYEEKVESIDSEEHSTLIVNEIRKLGWGFCSTNRIVLGSAIVPFGLIYPHIGGSFKFLNSSRLAKRIKGQLSLEILDVSGKPLECKCCDIDLLHLEVSSKLKSDDINKTMEVQSSEGQTVNFGNRFLHISKAETLKLHVKDVRRDMECENIEKFSMDCFLVQSRESGKRGNNGLDNLFADRVLELLSSESELFKKHSVPIWQIFLNFLYKEGYWGLLSVSNSNGDYYMGILRPFTVHSAFLYILDNKRNILLDASGLDLPVVENIISQGDNDCQKGTTHGKRRKNRKSAQQNLTWSSFCEAAFDFSDLDLAEVYFANDIKKSKRLKFLKCWMKQVKTHQNVPDVAKSSQQKETDVDERLTASYQESDNPLSMHIYYDQSRKQEGPAFEFCSETSETFFRNLPKKTQHGLECDGVDLKIMAERLVKSSIYWLREKYKALEKVDESCASHVAELIKLLLWEPKDLKKHKDTNPLLQAPNPDSTSEKLVREYELQIFLRMEILQSELAESIKGIIKQKLVKQICSLLEIIQYLVEGGFHGEVSLYDYVERTIKTRYFENLGDVVNKIYDQMDLLPFGEEHEAQALLLNSEDSNQSWRDKHDTSDTKKIQELVSTEYESTQPLENVDTSHKGHAQKLSEARERRERARRSFTSRMPDLQRVWAPKQSKATKVKPDKESKRKKQHRASYSVVCETPLTVKEPSCSSCSSVSKALFQDDP